MFRLFTPTHINYPKPFYSYKLSCKDLYKAAITPAKPSATAAPAKPLALAALVVTCAGADAVLTVTFPDGAVTFREVAFREVDFGEVAGVVVGWTWITEELVKTATLDEATCEPDEDGAATVPVSEMRATVRL